MAQKKMGRPPSGDKPMKERIFVLVNDETKDKLEQCKKALGTTTSDVVRKGIDKVFDSLEKK
ncbi:CopG family transcriptional regulator [Beduinella massiliensis]|uniref:CopG family transcriptional regulator n=1 Tax=Beduinella massiliensis TaxID=1852363 RepID=UPI000C843733